MWPFRKLYQQCVLVCVVLCAAGVTPLRAVTLSAPEKALANLLVNGPGQQRKSLQLDVTLTRVARARANDMAKRGYFGHVNPDGNGPNYLVKAAGYPLPESYVQQRDVNYIESIAAGRASAGSTWEDFLESSGHRRHLLGEIDFYRKQTAYGVGHVYVPGSEYGHYWVVLTAPPRPAPAVAITSPAPNAKVFEPLVSILGTAGGGGTVPSAVEIRLENATGAGAWVPVTGLTTWNATLTGLTPGDNSVQVRSLDTSGNVIGEASRTIVYAVMRPLMVSIVGNGSVTAGFQGETPRELGAEYSMTAKPATGSLFAGWSGGLTGSKASVSFTMIEGLTVTANFVPDPFLTRGGTYGGAIVSETNPSQATSGVVNFTLNRKGAFSGKLKLGKASYTLTGRFDVNGNAIVIVKGKKKPTLTVNLKLDVTGSTGVTVTVSDGNFTSTAQAARTRRKATGAYAQTGRYTISLPRNPDEADSGAPQGNGYGTLVISSAGRAQLLAKLADGTPFSQGGTISEDGTLVIYSSLYSGKGVVAGRLRLASTDVSDVEGSVIWAKSERVSDQFYPGGFETVLPIVGSRYVVPAFGTPAVRVRAGEENGDLGLEEGNLTDKLEQPLTIDANNQVRINSSDSNMAVTISPTTGLFKGTFTHPTSGRIHTIQGAILQSQNAGYGYFLGIDQSGVSVVTPRAE